MADLEHCIIVFYTEQLDLIWRYRNISLAFISVRTFKAIASPLNLESIWQPRNSTVSCSLMEWPAKDILISFREWIYFYRLQNELTVYCL